MIPLLHPTLFALLLTLAALGAPFVCPGTSIVFGGSKIVAVDSDFMLGESDITATARSIQAGSLCFRKAKNSSNSGFLTNLWSMVSIDACLGAVPPPSVRA